MFFYALYRIGIFLALIFPLRFSYTIAAAIAYTYYLFSRDDRAAVNENIRTVMGGAISEKDVGRISRAAFGNFAKYLVDFFRFTLIDDDYVRRFVRIEGTEHIDTALAGGKGVILLSAHLGNWELGAAVTSKIGYPVNAVVLTHRNRLVNNFFRRQRETVSVRPIEIGMTLKNCYRILRANGLLALLGDRDFTRNGMMMDFFGKKALIPRGPAALSTRLGSAIVPCFMIRQADDTFRFVFEEPIFPPEGPAHADEDAAVMTLARKYLGVIERYIRANPGQWYVFRSIWSSDEILRSDTII